jgi:hypothetical protein
MRLTIPGDHGLADGTYLATVAYVEKRPFGDLRLGRMASTMRRFTVDSRHGE